jgi:glutamyl-tRNA reductase
VQLLVLGLNYTTAPLALRERATFAGERLRAALADLRELSALATESAILSTCNRTELYCVVRDPGAARGPLADWLERASELPPGELRAHLYARRQLEAVRHAFRVASGLDSMVLGEPHILGQMKDAARHAQAAGTLGAHLHQLFQRSFAVAKEVRSRTEIGSASVSLAAAAVRLAQRVFDDLRETRVLLVGAGKMIELAASQFAALRPRAIVVANRTPERAEQLAERFSGATLPLADVPERLEHFDIVVACTSSPQPILGFAAVERASRARQRKPLFMVDLAVPRGIEPAAACLPQVLLYTVDDLGEAAQSGMTSRQAAIADAEAIIDSHVASFMRWLAGRSAVPLLRRIDQRAETLRSRELRRARRLLARGHPVETVLAGLATGLSNKLLHAPRALLARGALAPETAQRLVEQWDRMRGSAS